MNLQQQLIDLLPTKEFFIGIDSDGCVFDTMEIKHKECFCPNYIKYFGLQPVSKYAREVWEFVNLYSKTRGCNRFIALQKALRFLNEREEVQRRNFKTMDFSPNWLHSMMIERVAERTPLINLLGGKVIAWGIK